MPTLSELLGVNSTTVHGNSRIADALRRQGVPKTPELIRVINLPRRKFDPSVYPDASILYAKGHCGRSDCRYCAGGGPGLRPLQNALIIEAAQNSGAFAAIGVGGGKTIPGFLLHDAMDATTTVLLVPANLREKTFSDLPGIQAHFKIPPVYRSEDWEKDKPGIYVLSYNEISDTDASDLLDKIKPDLIVADEVQNLKRKESARTRRFLRFMRKNPCKFVAMTGSPITKGLMDFAHLLELALGKGSPLPIDYPTLSAMADAIDNEGQEGATGIGALALMMEDDESARDAFCRRFWETPGVIVTNDPSCTLPIEIREFPIAPPQEITDALADLENKWSWDGEEYDLALDIARLQRQLTQGYFYRALWPGGIPDREYLEKRNAWKRAIRQRLTHQNRVGQDSPALLEALAESGQWTPAEWVDWLTVRDRPEPARVPIEVNRWLVDVALRWLQNIGEPGIIWVTSPTVGQWLQEAGIPYYGEGQDEELNKLASDCLDDGRPIMPIACSVFAHGTGKNLQAWSHNLILYPVSQGALWEQLIGRTHRPGQKAQKVTVDVVLGSVAALRAMATAWEDADRIGETIGQTQRLQLAQRLDPDDRI
jgi:hypothetical protein